MKRSFAWAAALALVLRANQAWPLAGEFDQSFDGDGILAIANYPYMTLVQSDNKILYYACSGGDCTDLNNYGLFRVSTDGTLDLTFDGDGYLPLPSADVKLLGSWIYAYSYDGVDNNVTRYDASGVLDLTYGDSGVFRLTGSPCLVTSDYPILDSMGRWVSMGIIAGSFSILRCNADGSADSTFSMDGEANTIVAGERAFERSRAFVIQPSDKIVVLGESIWEEGGEIDPGDDEDLSEDEGFARGGSTLALVRYDTDGTLDTTFSGTGKALFAAHNFIVEGVALFQTADSKLIAVGKGLEVLPGDHDLHTLALARFTADGERDPSFGDGGVVISEFPYGFSLDAAALQPDGKILVVGQNDLAGPGDSTNILVRFGLDGTPDLTFGEDAVAGVDSTPGSFYRSMMVDSLGRAILVRSGAIVRLLGDCIQNGLVEPGEECDDGDFNDANGCTNLCAIRECAVCTGSNPSDCSGFASAGTACDDGNFCTSNDQCDAAGHCTAEPQPLPSCTAAENTKFSLGQGTTDDKDKLAWGWEDVYAPGDPTYDFGNALTGGTGYTLCVFDGNGTLLRADLPAGSFCGDTRCWKADGDLEHYIYNDRTLANGGIQKLSITDSDDRKFQLKGKGANLPDPAGALSDPVTVQLIKRDDGNGKCFESTFTGTDIKKATATSFKALKKP